jgi:hypothetical protein
MLGDITIHKVLVFSLVSYEHQFFGTSLSGVANRLVALEEFWTCRAAQLNLEQRASSNPA